MSCGDGETLHRCRSFLGSDRQQIEVHLRCYGCLDIKLRRMRRTRQDLLTFGACEQGLAEQVTASAQVLHCC